MPENGSPPAREPRTGVNPAPIKPAPRPKPWVEPKVRPDVVIKENG